MTWRSLLTSVALLAPLAAAGCGPSPTMQQEDQTQVADETTGDEATVEPATGPAPSFLPDSPRVFARIDVSRIRASPVGPDISSAIRATRTWQTYAGASGIDPIQSFDAIVIAADTMYADERTILLRHTQDDVAVRDAILRMSVARGGTPTWSQVEDISVAVPPQELPVEHSVALTAVHECVLTPTTDVPRVVQVAHAQRARRTTPEQAMDPRLAFDPGEVVTFVSDEPPPAREGYPAPPQRYRVNVTEDAGHEVTVRIHAEFDTPEHCHAAHEFLATQASYYASQMLVRAAGLARPLEEAQFTESGTSLDATTRLTPDEQRRALGAIALMQLSSTQ